MSEPRSTVTNTDERVAEGIVRGGVSEGSDRLSEDPQERRQALRVLAASALAQGTEAYCIQGIPVLLTFIRQDIALTAVQMGALASAPYVANLLFCLAVGQYLERWGSKLVITVGLLVIGVGMTICSASQSYPQIYFGLIVTGLGFTTVYPGTTKAIMENTPARLRGTFMGLKQMGVTLGAAFGAAVLPVAAVRWSWQMSLVGVGALAALSGFAWAWMFGRDVHGPAVVTATVVKGALQSPVRRESQHLLLQFLRRYGANKALWMVNSLAMGLMILQTTTSIWLPTYLKQGLSWDPITAGRALACLQVGGALGRGSLGAVSDALGRNRAAVAGVCGAAAGACLFLLTFAGPSMTVAAVCGLALVIGYFAVGWVGVVTVMRAELLPGETGRVTSFGLFFMALGSAVGPPAFGWLTKEGSAFGTAWMSLASVGLLTAVLAAVAGRKARTMSVAERGDS